ncbi:hypothetical protein BH10PSE17_BH10PSE17_26810 [soil metagenome]
MIRSIAILMATLSLSMPATSRAEGTSKPSSGEYGKDLGTIYGTFNAARWMGEVCSADFPSLRSQNEAAYAQWKQPRVSLLDDIDTRMKDLLRREVSGNSKEYAAKLEAFDKGEEESRVRFGALLKKNGPQTYETTCRYYPTYLRSPGMDVEHDMADLLVTVRRGLPR